MSYHVENTLIESRLKIGGRLREHFIPKIVQASLEWDQDDLRESSVYFPYATSYGDFVPAWDFFEVAFMRLRHILVIVLEILAMISIISQQENSNARLFSLLTVSFLTVAFLSPTNGVGGNGYTFWTNNRDYNRLMVLFNIAFDHRYRDTVVKDGLVEYLCEEYKQVSDSLGIVKADTSILGWHLAPPWYWGLALSWIINYPMALVALAFPWTSLRSPVASMAIFQYAIFTMRHSIKALKDVYGKESFFGIMTRVRKFYNILDKSTPPPAGDFLDRPTASFRPRNHKGAKITLKNVAYKYPSASLSAPNAIDNVNLDINPGQLIVIAGENGSGKTTLVKLLSGLARPTSGEIIIDDEPLLSEYDAKRLRQTNTFVGQAEAIYPVSLRENILMGLTNQSLRDAISQEDLEEAARLGGSQNLIMRLGYDKVLNPCSIPCYSINEQPGRAAIDALKRNSPDPIPIPISSGEHQRLIASRAFMRVKHGNAKLIILDEPTNALDTLAESDIFNNFRTIARDRGQTMVVVTHRLASVAKHADLIVCMVNGKIAEHGTHDKLMASGGVYSVLYKAQIVLN
ncbi:P-loop containing nucleoside triphosphate hydrolase protein [Flammula alnicola]|nr:P-loop containing nucleoside triphosphate hydrolase protein [Flammula alnicola]